MGLGGLIAQGLFIGFLILYVWAFWWGYTSPTRTPNNQSDSSEENFFYAAMWQDMNSD